MEVSKYKSLSRRSKTTNIAPFGGRCWQDLFFQFWPQRIGGTDEKMDLNFSSGHPDADQFLKKLNQAVPTLFKFISYEMG